MKIRRLVLFASVIMAIVLLLGFIFKNQLLHAAFAHIQARIKKTYHAQLHVSDIRFSGYNSIMLSDLTLQPDGADTLLNVHDAELQFAVTSLLRGKPAFNFIKLNDINITINNSTVRNNLNFLKISGKQKNVPDSNTKVNYKDLAERIDEKLIQALNTAFTVNNLQISYRDSTRMENIYAPAINYDLKHLTGLIINRQIPDSFQLGGTVLEKDRKYEFVAQHLGSNISSLPFLDAEKGLKACFQSVIGTVELDKGSNEFEVKFNISATGFHVNHWRLARQDVVFPIAQVQGILQAADEMLQLDSSSYLVMNHAKFRLFANYHREDTASELSFAVHMPETVSDTFFNALPSGAFNTLKGISCSGTLAYDLQFQINTAQPDSLVFLSNLSRKNFHINHYGEENYGRVNAPFVYNAYNGEQLVRTIEIGPENPTYTPLQRINPLLIKCILQSEDPSFMTHRGFLAESFRESIVQDYHEKRFARGGGPISMQFVKNVFLSRDKTVSRKAQEALIVYLIENLGLISKERMLEIYLNVIEWGPDIYGVGEASEFYFNKKPAELNLQECLFLAAIIPNPKYFRYQFDKDGHVKSYMADFFKLLAGRMATRNLISDEDLQQLVPDVKLTGPASRLVMPTDSLPPDEELEEME